MRHDRIARAIADVYPMLPAAEDEAPVTLRPNALPQQAIVVHGDMNSPAVAIGEQVHDAGPRSSSNHRPAIDADQEEADLRLWLLLPVDVRRASLERIESAVTAHPAPEAGRIIAAWRTVPEGMKAEWRKALSKAAGVSPYSAKAPRAMTAPTPVG